MKLALLITIVYNYANSNGNQNKNQLSFLTTCTWKTAQLIKMQGKPFSVFKNSVSILKMAAN